MCGVRCYLKHVLYDEIGLSHHTEESHVSPGKQRELAEIVLLHQRQDEPHEPWDTDCTTNCMISGPVHTHDVHGERNKSVILDQEGQEVHLVDDDSELFHQGFSVEEVVGSNEKIPRE